MDIERELKDKLLKLFEETDRQSYEQEAYIQELRQRLYLAEKVCFEANGYLKNKDNPLGGIHLERLEDAVNEFKKNVEIAQKLWGGEKGVEYAEYRR